MYTQYLKDFDKVLKDVRITNSNDSDIPVQSAMEEMLEAISQKKTSKRVYLIGNGGSSGIVSHGAIDFLNACGYRAQALTDNSLLTCMANDYGYENVFTQTLKTLLEEGDILIAISSSGNSPNIHSAASYAKDRNCTVITFSGFKADNKLRSCGDFNFWLESEHYGQVEIGHSLILHYLTDRLAQMK